MPLLIDDRNARDDSPIRELDNMAGGGDLADTIIIQKHESLAV
jgi:hypothetical protein